LPAGGVNDAVMSQAAGYRFQARGFKRQLVTRNL
jgi:hypothetical protein